MGKQALKNKLLKAVEAINNSLINVVKTSEHGSYWHTMGLVEGKITWELNENLYCGVAGIGLYFLRQYKALGNQKHLELAKESIRYAAYLAENTAAASPAFLTGKMGVALTMVELHHTDANNDMLQRGIELAKQSAAVLRTSWDICDYINGASGRLHALVHIHQLTGNPEIPQLINDLAEDLLRKSWLYKKVFTGTAAVSRFADCADFLTEPAE
ncbi:MAG: lanthionine synthetase LanC family protein [Bacteroidota bacterium]